MRLVKGAAFLSRIEVKKPTCSPLPLAHVKGEVKYLPRYF
jgi:hypothetical protein